MSYIHNTLTVKNPSAWRRSRKVVELMQYYYIEELARLVSLAKKQSEMAKGRCLVENLPEYKSLLKKVEEENIEFLSTFK